MSRPIRSLRLLRRSAESLDNLSANSGEIFYDSDNRTLRLFTGVGNDRSILATRTWTREYVEDNKFSGNYNELTNLPSIPADTADLTNGAGFITQADVDQSLSGVDLTGYATEDYVDTAISNIPEVDLTGYATETFVGTAISNLIDTAPTALNTLNELAAALNDDANFATTVTTALGDKAPINNPTFTGTVGGVTATHVGLGNVTNESKVTMFTSPTFTSNGTNAVMSINSEGVDFLRGGITLDDSSGTGATRISFRDSGGQLGYIEPFQSPVPSGLPEGYNTGLKFITGRSVFVPQLQLAPQGTTLIPGDSGLTIPGNVKITRDSNRSLIKDIDYTFLYFDRVPISDFYYAALRPLPAFPPPEDPTLGLEIGMTVNLATSDQGTISAVLTNVVYNVVNDELLINWESPAPGTGPTGTSGSLNAILRPDGGVVTALKLNVGALTVTGTTILQQSMDLIDYKVFAENVVDHDFLISAIWYHTAMNGNFTANFTNITVDSNKAISVVLILEQDVVTPYVPTALQINGDFQTIRWQDDSAPTGNANAIDVVSFTLIRKVNDWTVLGSLTTYG
jgi:hypothetical protein